MSQITERNTLSRQWEILRLLPSVGVGISARELVKRLTSLGFNVSKRTVERDLNELSRQFPLLCNDKSRPYGWRWMDNASFDIPNLSISDCVSLAITEEVIAPLLPPSVLRPLKPRFEYAKKHLQEANRDHALAQWTDKVAIRTPSMPLLPPAIDGQVLNTIQSALLDDKQVKVVYSGVWVCGLEWGTEFKDLADLEKAMEGPFNVGNWDGQVQERLKYQYNNKIAWLYSYLYDWEHGHKEQAVRHKLMCSDGIGFKMNAFPISFKNRSSVS